MDIGHEYERLRQEKIARNEAHLAKLGFNKELKTKKTKKKKTRKTRTPPSDEPRRKNLVRTSRIMINYEEKENGEDDGSSDGGVRVRPTSNLDIGSRVHVDFKGTLYKATIRKHRVKSDKIEFLIHFDGNKKYNVRWIPVDSIKSTDEPSEDGEEDEDNDKDNEDDDDNNDDVGCFSNEVEGGVPCAPHTTWIKRLHNLNQTPSYRRSDAEKYEIQNIMKKLNEMKSRGEIGGKPCGLNISWTFEKNQIGEHRIGRMVGQSMSFIVYPEIICTGDNPSLGEVISGIKQTKNTKIGKDVSIIEVPSDMLEYCGFDQIAQNAKSFITSRFEIIFGLKNENGELEMYYFGEKISKGEGRKNITIPKRMFANSQRTMGKVLSRGRFGLMCFSTNRNKNDWERCECDHMNGDPTDDREENVRWLTPADNKNNYRKKGPVISCRTKLAKLVSV